MLSMTRRDVLLLTTCLALVCTSFGCSDSNAELGRAPPDGIASGDVASDDAATAHGGAPHDAATHDAATHDAATHDAAAESGVEPFVDFPIDRAEGAGPRIVAALSASAVDNTAALEAAFALANHGGTVSIPAGTYSFTSVINLSELDNILVEGNGARLVLTQGAAILVSDSSRLLFKDLVLDWDWKSKPLAYLGVVEGMTESAIQFDFPLDATLPNSIDWWNVEMIDQTTFAPAAAGLEWFDVNPPTQDKVDANSLRIAGVNGKLSALRVGDAVRIRQRVNANTSSHVWYLNNTSHTIFKNVAIYSGSYMGYVLNNNTHHILLDSCRIVPDPQATGSKQIISTFADGLHIAHFTGYLGVINSEFSHQGDDALNIKQNVASVVDRVSDTKLRVTTEQWFSPYAVGDTLELRDYADFRILGVTPPVTNVTWDGGAANLTFGAPLPALPGRDIIVINERFNTGQYFVRNNYFHANRARGVLPKLPNGVIDGNRFEGMSMPAILFEFGRWDGVHAEGSFVNNVKITNNAFVNVNAFGWYPADISYRVKGQDYADSSAYPNLFSNLTIGGNSH